SKARDELERLAGRPVVEVSAETAGPLADAPGIVGTEAVLPRVNRAGVVAFLDFDQELLAPRYRAGEEALALLARAARLVGGRRDGGGVVIPKGGPQPEVRGGGVFNPDGRPDPRGAGRGRPRRPRPLRRCRVGPAGRPPVSARVGAGRDL